MTKSWVWSATAIMSTLLALLIVWQFRVVIIYVLASLALAAALRPIVQGWVRQGFVIRLALILLCLVILGSVGFLLFLGGVFATREVRQLVQMLPVQDEWRLPLWLKGRSFEQAVITRLPSPGDLFNAFTGDQGQLVLPTLLGFTQDIAKVVSGLLIAVVLSLYWSLNQLHFERLWFSLLPFDQRKRTREIWRTVESDIGAYIRSQLIQGILAGLLLGLGYWLLGSPYPTLLALTAALAYQIPIFGPALIIVLPLLVGLLTSVQLSLLMALYTLLVLLIVNAWVKPQLFKRGWDNPILTLLILIALADAFGLLGIIVAPPLSVVCQILWSHLVSHRTVVETEVKLSDLKARQAAVMTAIEALAEPPLPLLNSSIERLTQLIEQAAPLLTVDSSQSFHIPPPLTK